MKKIMVVLIILALLALAAGPAFAAPRVFGELYYDDQILRTFVTPANLPHGGIDPLYTFPEGGAEGQLSVSAVGPGDADYHGGRWAVYEVIWNTEPYLLTNDGAVLAAEAAGDVTITRTPEADNRCPVLP